MGVSPWNASPTISPIRQQNSLAKRVHGAAARLRLRLRRGHAHIRPIRDQCPSPRWLRSAKRPVPTRTQIDFQPSVARPCRVGPIAGVTAPYRSHPRNTARKQRPLPMQSRIFQTRISPAINQLAAQPPVSRSSHPYNPSECAAGHRDSRPPLERKQDT